MKDDRNVELIYDAAIHGIERLRDTDFAEPFIVKAVWGLAKLGTITGCEKIDELIRRLPSEYVVEEAEKALKLSGCN